MGKYDGGKVLIIDKNGKERKDGQNGGGKKSGKGVFFQFMRIEPDQKDIYGEK